jgi:RNA polymerase sigma factor (sigma-70 family)
MATRLCLEYLRREHALPLEDQDVLISTLASPRQDAEAAELHAAVRKLKPKQRMAISLHYWQGYSYEDVARCMDAPVGSVRSWLYRANRSWLYRAKKQLKEVLS